MSDAGDDLFGDEEAPVASGSKSPSPAQSSATLPAPASPREDNDDGDNAGDLFGDDDEDDQPPRRGSPTATPSSSRSRSRSRNPLEYEEDDEGLANQQETYLNMAVPQWPKLQPTDGKVWHMKLPAYVNIEPKPYDPDLYRATLDDDPVESNIAAKSKMIGVRNTVRWKWVTGPDGEPTRQSNARMLRWSDGSVSLQLGSDLFDVAPSHGATLARSQDPQPPAAAEDTQASTTFLCVAAPQEQVLVTENSIAGQLSLLPTSMTSKTHMELVKHVGQQHVKHSRMKMLEETQDEASLQKLLLKSVSRDVVKSKAGPRKAGGGGNKGKKSVKRGYSSDEEEEESGDEVRPRKRAESVEYSDDDGFVVADSEDEDEYGAGAGGGSKKKKQGKGKKRKGSDSDVDDFDEMEEAERRIEERERERKRAKKESAGAGASASAGAGGGGKSKSTSKSRDYVDSDDEDGEEDAEGEEEMDMDMDVESEEE